MKIEIAAVTITPLAAYITYYHVEAKRYENTTMPLPAEPVTEEDFIASVRQHMNLMERAGERFQWLMDNSHAEIEIGEVTP